MPYSRFGEKELILRDHLAIDRTLLSNERSFLAYIRTGLGFFLASATLLKFFDITIAHILGWILSPIAILTMLIGFIRYSKMKNQINKLKNK